MIRKIIVLYILIRKFEREMQDNELVSLPGLLMK